MVEIDDENCEIKVKKIGEKIKFYRKKANLSQEALGNHINSCQNYISDIERGKYQVTVRFLYKISIALNIDICNFFKDNNI
ncbi:MAG: transcriptional regulator [Candidatus Cloacimonadota bacterium]|nr:MAG: transcriptional regulator [Candidatus Cloacimonadota bacterium]